MTKNINFIVRFVILPGLFVLTSCAKSSSQTPLMVSEVVNDSGLLNRQVRVSGAVVGESIKVESTIQQVSFLIADIPVNEERIEKEGGIEAVLENAVNDPNRQRLQIVYIGDKPDLLTNMAHAIILGELHSDGIFYADSIALVFSSNSEQLLFQQGIEKSIDPVYVISVRPPINGRVREKAQSDQNKR